MKMKKETTKGLWYLSIMVLTTLLIMGMTYQAKVRQKQAGLNSKTTKSKTAGQSTGKSALGGGTDSSSASGQGGGTSYTLSAKNGGKLGDSYLLKNLSSTKGSGYESANIFVKALSGSKYVPKYKATISGNMIDLVMEDTRNIDFNSGGKSYSGSNPLRVNGAIIKSISYYAAAESRLGIKITLNKQSPFQVVAKADPLTIEVRVKN